MLDSIHLVADGPPLTPLQKAVSEGYAMGLRVQTIADTCNTSPAVVRVTAMRLGLKHPKGRGRPKKGLA
jgi:DNA-binding NarL/FixJ family response regulator